MDKGIDKLGSSIRDNAVGKSKVGVDIFVVQARKLGASNRIMARGIDNVFAEVICEDAYHIVAF